MVSNWDELEQASFRELIRAFLVGFRFDLATTMITLMVPFTFIWLPMKPAARKLWDQAMTAVLAALLIAMTLTLWGDLLYYREIHRHITSEPILLFSDLPSMTKLVVMQYPIPLLAVIAVCVAAGYYIWKLGSKYAKEELDIPGWQWVRLIILIPFAGLTFIGGRGGIQKEPLKSADALGGKIIASANLSLNGWYSFLVETTRKGRPTNYMPRDEAISVVRSLIDDKQRLFNNEKYPLLRRTDTEDKITAPGEKINIVLLIIESWNADYLQTFGGQTKVMPFLDSLATQSVIFTNCQSVATRSFRGVCSILTSYPLLNEDSYRLTFLLPRMSGIGTILRSQGYATRFTHAAQLNSMGITSLAQLAGYEHFYSRSDFDEKDFNGSWGTWDHVTLQHLTAVMDSLPEPFHATLFNLCTHVPYALPEDYKLPFQIDHRISGIAKTFIYYDEVLRDFFAREAQRPRFKNTLYVLVGDHTGHAPEPERFRIGCLFYAPGRLEPRVDSTLCSQLNILPSILDLAGIDVEEACFGASLFSKHDKAHWSMTSWSNLLFWQQDSLILETDLGPDIALSRSKGIREGWERITDNAGQGTMLRKQAQAVYQVTQTLTRENALVPPNEYR